MRRVAVVGVVLGVIGAVAVLLWRRFAQGPWPSTPQPEWPPFEVDPPAVWVAPVDGRCPDTHPIKVNTRSGIYHVPGGRSYERTLPDRCYATSDGAERDGYRRAKA